MLRFHLRLIVLLLLIFIAALLLIRTQPYDDRDLRQTLLPVGCPAPCFMGIRPGVTTVEEALKILAANEWVEKIDYQAGDRIIKMKWNTKRPLWLANDGLYGGASLWIKDGLVTDVRLDTDITLGTIRLILGPSPFQYVSRGNLEGHRYLFYSALYSNLGIFTDVSNTCSSEHNDITFQDKIYLGYAQLGNTEDLPHQYYYSWTDVVGTLCDQW